MNHQKPTAPGKTRHPPLAYASDWIERLDGRTALARAVQQRLAGLHDSLGGAAALSYQEGSLCKRIVWLEALIESREAAMARGEEVDEARYLAAVATLAGLLKTLGMERRSRGVTLRDYLQAAP